MKCKSCNKPCNSDADRQVFNKFDVCKDCFREPETNYCEGGCGRKLNGIAYPYTCGPCFIHSSRK